MTPRPDGRRILRFPRAFATSLASARGALRSEAGKRPAHVETCHQPRWPRYVLPMPAHKNWSGEAKGYGLVILLMLAFWIRFWSCSALH